MIKYIFLILSLFITGCQTSSDSQHIGKPKILVSIAPYKAIVNHIGGDTVSTVLLVPSGGSPHSYEPTTRDILNAAQAKAWFRMGEGFEHRALQALKSNNPDMKVLDLRDGIDLLPSDHKGCSHGDCGDPHTWLSPRLAKQQATTIANTLTEISPENRDLYQKNLQQLLNKLDSIDNEIKKTLKPLKNRTLVVSHPAFAYFAKDYDLKQLPIEFEGKDPTPKKLTSTLNQARDLKTTTVFIQLQHQNKGAQLIADELNAKVVEVDPLSENYPDNLLNLAKKFADQ